MKEYVEGSISSEKIRWISQLIVLINKKKNGRGIRALGTSQGVARRRGGARNGSV